MAKQFIKHFVENYLWSRFQTHSRRCSIRGIWWLQPRENQTRFRGILMLREYWSDWITYLGLIFMEMLTFIFCFILQVYLLHLQIHSLFWSQENKIGHVSTNKILIGGWSRLLYVPFLFSNIYIKSIWLGWSNEE